MPELPEVEYGRKVAAGVAQGRVIAEVWCADDRIVFDGVGPKAVAAALRGRTVKSVLRRGKHVWFELDRGPHPLFHFGMTGAFVVPGTETLRLASSPVVAPEDWPPRFCKILLTFSDGGRLAMTTARRFGRIRLRAEPLQEPPLRDLGFDPLLELPAAQDLKQRIGQRRVTLKGLLLDQRFAAGVGNWLADDILYDAGLAPQRSAKTLAHEEILRLRKSLRRVVCEAVAADANNAKFPAHWLFHRRWEGSHGDRDTYGHSVVFEKVAGRTTVWVPERQR